MLKPLKLGSTLNYRFHFSVSFPFLRDNTVSSSAKHKPLELAILGLAGILQTFMTQGTITQPGRGGLWNVIVLTAASQCIVC